jgi:hypothetical protein
MLVCVFVLSIFLKIHLYFSGLEIKDGHVSVMGKKVHYLTYYILFLNKIIDVAQRPTTLNDGETGEETEVLIRPDESPKAKPVTFFRAWLLPGVAMVPKILIFS